MTRLTPPFVAQPADRRDTSAQPMSQGAADRETRFAVAGAPSRAAGRYGGTKKSPMARLFVRILLEPSHARESALVPAYLVLNALAFSAAAGAFFILEARTSSITFSYSEARMMIGQRWTSLPSTKRITVGM